MDVNHALQQKSLEIKQDFVERERQHLNTFVNTQVTEHQNIAHQAITTNMSQVAIRMHPPVTSGVVGGGGGVMPLHVTTPIISNMVNTIPLTLSSDALPVPPPPDTGNLIVMAGTTPEEIDTILATQYTHYLDTNYDVALTTDGASQWNATETYNVFLATENTAQALYYQAIQSGLLDLGMSRFALDTLSPEQVFRNAIGHVDIQKIGSGTTLIPIHTQWDADNDNSTIFFPPGFDWAIPDSLQWAITREFGQILDHRSFNYGTSELQRNGIPHTDYRTGVTENVSGFNETWLGTTTPIWIRGNEGMIDMSYVGGPSINSVKTDNPASDEWADMFAHWVNFTNFRMTQPYNLSEEELRDRFITDYLGYQIVPLREDSHNLTQEEAARIYLDLLNSHPYLSSHPSATPTGILPDEYQNLTSGEIIEIANIEASNRGHWELPSIIDEADKLNLSLGLYPSLAYMLPQYVQAGQHFDTYFNRMSRMDNWVSGSLFTANLWREPSFQDNLRKEMQAVQASGVLDTPIFDDFFTETVYPIYEIEGLSTVDVHADLKNNVEIYAQNIKSLEDASPTSLKNTYQAQRQLLLRILPALLYTENSSFPDVVTGNRQTISSNNDIYQYTPYQFHSFSNAELGMLTQLALTDPQMYDQMVAWYESDEFRPDETVRDVTNTPVVSQVATVIEDRPWLVDASMFAGSMLCEPIDWALSSIDILTALGDANLAGAGLILGLTLLPGGMTRVADDLGWLGRHVDDIAEKYPRPIGAGGPFIYSGNTYGISSGRWFDSNLSAIGVEIRPLSYENVKVTHNGIDVVVKHLNRFGPDDANDIMINRLRQIANGTLQPTETDIRFYTHELREYVRYRSLGWETGVPSNVDEADILWNNTHTATLEDYELSDGDLYHE